ncbi:hypothetical protein, partial [Stutzerimonas balearica]|uniref:hypothetical protein n=1 Tax=Stutzerimonas balearica TaxID=74829 RepID=UPI00384D865D
STHRLGLASAEEDSRHFARARRALAFFNGLLGRLPGPARRLPTARLRDSITLLVEIKVADQELSRTNGKL